MVLAGLFASQGCSIRSPLEPVSEKCHTLYKADILFRAVGSLAITLYVATIIIFAHVILLPARGHQVDVSRERLWLADS